jgi:hypothetical protein
MLQRTKLVAGCNLKHVTASSPKAWVRSLAQSYRAQSISRTGTDGQHQGTHMPCSNTVHQLLKP